MAKEQGAGILFYRREPVKMVMLLMRDQKHPNPAKTLPFPGMLDIPGGHIDKGESFEDCIAREIAEEWTDLRTGRPFMLQSPLLFERLEDNETIQYVFCKEMDFDLTDIDYCEGAAIALINESAAMRTEIAYGCTDLLRRFFKSHFMGV
jgi:8-oxo-dGTP diphosphatase